MCDLCVKTLRYTEIKINLMRKQNLLIHINLIIKHLTRTVKKLNVGVMFISCLYAGGTLDRQFHRRHITLRKAKGGNYKIKEGSIPFRPWYCGTTDNVISNACAFPMKKV